jgi:hypothetical protein
MEIQFISRKARSLSDLHRQRIGDANRGKRRKLTDQHKANIAKAQAAYYLRVRSALANFKT